MPIINCVDWMSSIRIKRGNKSGRIEPTTLSFPSSSLVFCSSLRPFATTGLKKLSEMDEHRRKHRSQEHSSHRRHHHHRGEDQARGSRDAKAPIQPVHRILREMQEPSVKQGDYVQRWLAQTADELPETAVFVPDKHGAKEIPVQSKVPSKQRPKFPLFLQNKDSDHDQCHLEQGKHGTYRIEVSSESSFLERGHAPEARVRINEREHLENLKPEVVSSPQKKLKRKRSSSPTVVGRDFVTSVEKPKEVFERRARHKTREDRYDVKKNPEKKERRSRPKKERENGKMVKNSEDLMHKFESKHVGNERLTATDTTISKTWAFQAWPRLITCQASWFT